MTDIPSQYTSYPSGVGAYAEAAATMLGAPKMPRTLRVLGPHSVLPWCCDWPMMIRRDHGPRTHECRVCMARKERP